MKRSNFLKTLGLGALGSLIATEATGATGGRDHYPNVFSAAVAGGGIQGGRVVGQSDSKGALPQENPKSPPDVLATVYRHLGVDRHKHYVDNNGRPHRVLASGNPIDELF